MKETNKRTGKLVLAAIATFLTAMCLVMFGGAVKAQAAAKECKFGFQYYEADWDEEYYEIIIEKEMLVHFELLYSPYDYSESIYKYCVQTPDSVNVIVNSDFYKSYNSRTGWYTATVSRILNPGTYYLYVNDGSLNYGGYLTVTTSDLVSLRNIKITGLDSKKKRTLTVTVPKKDEDADHIEVEYATNPDFTDAVTIEVLEGWKVTIKKLERGKKYYVRARQVAYYGDGGKQVSAWSVVKSKKVK